MQISAVTVLAFGHGWAPLCNASACMGGGRTAQARITKGETMRDPDSHDLDVLLRSAATVRRDPVDEERLFSAVWSRVQASISDEVTISGDDLQQRRLNLIGDREVAARRRRRAGRVASVALAVVVAGAGTAAAAEFISSRTGAEASGPNAGAAGPGEVLDLGGTDLHQVVEQVTADIPFPPGYEAQRADTVNSFTPDPGSFITEGHVRSWLAYNAVCTWADAWVAADNEGDTEARAKATGTLAGSVTWDAVVAFAEAHGEPSPADPGTGESYFGWLRPLSEAAESGSHQAVLDAVVSGNCNPAVMPVISADPGYVSYEGPR